MQEHLQREVPGVGLIEYETAPAGWVTKDGKRRQSDWRAYHLTPEQDCSCDSGWLGVGEEAEPCDWCKGSGRIRGKRTRLPSVTTWLGQVLPKDLTRYGEEHGIRGTMEAVRRGEIDPHEHTDEDAVHRVRALKLGADAARDRAATRGTDAHSIVEAFLRTGIAPRLAGWPPEIHGYIRALTDWVLAARPEPVEPVHVEQLVVSPTHGYAGRFDLIATINGVRTLVDFKTHPKGFIWPAAHFQTRAYARAAVECGDGPVDRVMIVVFAADGSFRTTECCVDDAMLDAALGFWRAVRPVNALCERANRAEKRAREVLAA